MSDWISLEEFTEINIKSCNTIHVDTRDFHVNASADVTDFNNDIDLVHSFKAVRSLLKHKSNSCKIKQSDIKQFLQNLYEMSGGPGHWRRLSFKRMREPWLKYIRLYRLDSEYFLFCGQYNIPENPQLCTKSNLKTKYLCCH